ncbi:MAG: hypothetical protein U5L04_00415 [Trueperaceae bacterium]|nr:hypothetical protein [Trueperaceae bacterium]
MTASAVVESTFRDGTVVEANNEAAPQLVLTVDSSVSAGLSVEGDEVTPSLDYRVSPSLGGELSDYIEADGGLGDVAGSLDTFFATVPSRLSLNFDAERWNAAADFAGNNYRLNGGFDLDTWRFDAEGGVATRDGTRGNFNVSAISRDSDLDLQLFGQTSGRFNDRSDSLAALYRVGVSDGLSLSAGLNLVGATVDEGGYAATFGLRQSLTWQLAEVDITQSYAGIPFSGIHGLGVSGGTRSIYPLGMRGTTFVQLSPSEQQWRNTVTVYGQPLNELTTTFSAGYTLATGGSSWRLSPALGLRVNVADLPISAATSYVYQNGTADDTASEHLFRVSAGSSYRDLGVTLASQYERSGATATDPAEWTFDLETDLRYALSVRSRLAANYTYSATTAATNSFSHRFAATWQQNWAGSLVSQLGYVRQFGFGGAASSESLLLTLVQRDFLQEGLTLSAGYVLSRDDNFFSSAAPLQNDLRVSLGYTFVLPFDTPVPVVDAFGGRRGGVAEGVAYVDQNLNGVRDANDPLLSGLTIALGSELTATDADGRYRLRLTEGEYPLEIVSGQSATIDLRGDATVAIRVNQTAQRDLVFVPVVNLNVFLFDDLNRNGELDEGETGIPYSGVEVSGAEERRSRTGVDGRIRLSGLVPGSYTITQDETFLPERYESTTPAVDIVLRTDMGPPQVVLGAAEVPRQVVSTFSGNRLAVIARANPARLPVGAEVTLQVLVSGVPERVSAVFAGETIALSSQGGPWSATLRIPAGTPLGSLSIPVVAEAPDQRVEQTVMLTITEGSPVDADDAVVTAGREAIININTLFRAETGSLELSNGDTLPLTSDDGYRWAAVWQASDTPGELSGQISFDGSVLAQITVTVESPSASGTDEEGE